MSFGERLKEARTLRGLTQKQLAEKLNIGSTTVTGYEKDNSEPNIITISKIMEILEVDANFLFQDETRELYKNEATPEEFENIIKKYRSLDQQGRETVSYILNRESKRVKELQKKSERIKELESENISNNAHIADIRIINYYCHLASAGTGQIMFNMPPTDKIEIPDIPEYKKVDYAIGVNDNSMEPEFSNGDILLIEMTEEIDDGEIGIFIVDNESFIKNQGIES